MTTPRYKRTKSLEERRLRKKANQRKYRETHQKQIKEYQQRTKEAARLRSERFMLKNADKKREYFKTYTQKNRERVRARNVLKWYGVTIEEWDHIFLLQGSRCAICKATHPGTHRGGWCGDHDHASNKFRGILCNVCNVMLGHAKDDIAILKRAIEYLHAPPYQQSALIDPQVHR